MKICNKCNNERQLNEFKKDPRNKDGLQGICKSCNKEWQQKRRDEIAKGVNVIIKTEKPCNKCEVIKPVEQFYRDTGSTDGYHSLCKQCRNESMEKWRNNNRSRYNKNMRELRASNKDWAKDTDLKRCYGIGLADYLKMKEAQKGVCAICKNPPKGKRPLVVDHDHITGEVRQLLCYGCNRALHALETPALLVAATEYLTKHKK